MCRRWKSSSTVTAASCTLTCTRGPRSRSRNGAWRRLRLLNDAYRTLKNPLDRTKYLLRLEGVQFEEDRGPNPSKVPADLLEEVFELNMQLEELRQNQKMGEDDPQLRRDLEAPRSNLPRNSAPSTSRCVRDGPLGMKPGIKTTNAKKTAAKEAMTALLQRRSYLQNLVRDVDQTLGGS